MRAPAPNMMLVAIQIADEEQRAPIGEDLAQARRAGIGVRPRERGAEAARTAERRAGLEDESRRSRHQAGIGGRGADHRIEIERRNRPVRERAGDRGQHEKGEEADRPAATRDRRPERDQPDAIDHDMRPRAMQERIGGEGPDAHAVSQHARIPDPARLRERVGIDGRAVDEVGQPLRPKRQAQARRARSPIAGSLRRGSHRRSIAGPRVSPAEPR